MDSQSVAWNCSYETKIAEDCILDKFIRKYNTLDTPDQKQLPNPTLIERDFEKMLVFSSYFHETNYTGAIIKEAKEKEDAAKEKAKKAKERAEKIAKGEEVSEEEEEDEASDEVKQSEEDEEKPKHVGGEVYEHYYYPTIYFFNVTK